MVISNFREAYFFHNPAGKFNVKCVLVNTTAEIEEKVSPRGNPNLGWCSVLQYMTNGRLWPLREEP